MRFTRSILIIGLACLVSCSGLQAQPEPGSTAYVRTVLGQLIQRELERGLPSISLALVKGDKVVWSAAYGYANLATKTPATPETVYLSASTWKSVTATALLTLVDAGKCQLDDPINQYLGDKPVQDNPDDPVTIRSLLNHTSGLSDDGGQDSRYNVQAWSRSNPQVPALEDIATTLKAIEPVGENWRYNNSAYGLAGLLVEKISGMPYEDYVVQAILKPAGITNHHPISLDPHMIERMAANYLRGKNGELVAESPSLSTFYAAGDAHIRAEDMARFLAIYLNDGAIGDKQIVSREMVMAAHRPFREKYGLGFWIYEDERGHTRVTHGGNWHAAVTAMLGDKTAGVGAFVATNVGQTQATYRIADAAVRLLRGEKVSPSGRQPVALGEKQLAKLAGRYQQADGIEISLRIDADKIIFQYPEYPPYNSVQWTYLPASPEVLFEPDMSMELRVKYNRQGQVEGFDMVQHGWIEYGFTRRIAE